MHLCAGVYIGMYTHGPALTPWSLFLPHWLTLTTMQATAAQSPNWFQTFPASLHSPSPLCCHCRPSSFPSLWALGLSAWHNVHVINLFVSTKFMSSWLNINIWDFKVCKCNACLGWNTSMSHCASSLSSRKMCLIQNPQSFPSAVCLEAWQKLSCVDRWHWKV